MKMGRLMKLCGVFTVLGAGLAACADTAEDSDAKQQAAQTWITMPDKSKLLEQGGDIQGIPADENSGETNAIAIDPTKTYQQIDGFGASLTDSSAWLIANKLSGEQRAELMIKLFDHDEGIGMSYLRLPVGASDFALSSYTYDDVPAGETDYPLARFSISHDKEYILPVLKQARTLNPDLRIMASPWSAPAWMKTSESLIGGSLKPEAYEVYANYLALFLEAYEAEGIPIDALTPQNEPHHVPDGYPGMRMEAFEQATFIKTHLGPVLEERGLHTKIVIWDHNWDEAYYPLTVLNDPEANRYIAGSAFHGYAGDVASQSQVHDAFPDKAIYFTESSGGEWATDFGGNLKWDMQNLIIGATRNWARTVLKWNLALDEQHGPQNGGCQDCRGIVTVNQQSGEVTLNEEYYAFGHASKFVKSGAYRIASSGMEEGALSHVAFRNPDGAIVLVAFNTAQTEASFDVRLGDQAYPVRLPAGAAATYVWPAFLPTGL
ncbi:glucosylceramidase [Paenibacillus phyllosphaerae]|uniref:Glucosylceramidase n=1 Tax=Paenibacillus phyllosphaerae TaxID=274593 RepID=A0A7W5AVG7_9BACL|nr:glycoside hydrolase family 30 beta sandwich domain-containing protein [Paenibacillus phyllosphaerae]MBB3108921.1 glucosylceramidase [Paenibacillus phyllosphaerae]